MDHRNIDLTEDYHIIDNGLKWSDFLQNHDFVNSKKLTSVDILYPNENITARREKEFVEQKEIRLVVHGVILNRLWSHNFHCEILVHRLMIESRNSYLFF